MAEYTQLMTAIIQKQISIIGAKVALQQAKGVQGITVSDSGEVTAGASKATLQLLVGQYKKIAGSVAVMFAKKAMGPLLSGKEDLPDELK